MDVKLQMGWDKETKGTIRFKASELAAGDKPAVSLLYVEKEAVADLGDWKELEVSLRRVA